MPRLDLDRPLGTPIRLFIVVLIGFCLGALSDAWLASRMQVRRSARPGAQPAGTGAPMPWPPLAEPRAPGHAEAAEGTAGHADPTPSPNPAAAVEELRARNLRLPIEGMDVELMKGGFTQPRGQRNHEAVDVLAPRGTPVRAVEAGIVAALETSRGGGISVYQYDFTYRFVYYYAHLDGYAPGLEEGATIAAGQVLGYVGTTGNAPADTPHLHFAIVLLRPGEGWWQGTPIDPYLVFPR